MDEVKNLKSAEMKFYAAVGALTSLSAALELTYLDIFMRATKLSEAAAGAVLVEIKSSSRQRDIALNSLSFALRGRSEEGAWKALAQRITSVTGASGLRNLAAHAAVSKSVTVFPGPARLARTPDGRLEETFGPFPPNRETEEDYRVQQDASRVLAGSGKRREADFEALLASAIKVAAVLKDLEEFLPRVP